MRRLIEISIFNGAANCDGARSGSTIMNASGDRREYLSSLRLLGERRSFVLERVEGGKYGGDAIDRSANNITAFLKRNRHLVRLPGRGRAGNGGPAHGGGRR